MPSSSAGTSERFEWNWLTSPPWPKISRPARSRAVEAVQHRWRCFVGREERLAHHPCRLFAQDSPITERAFVQMRHHEAGHVVSRRTDMARRQIAEVFVVDRDEPTTAVAVPLGMARFQRFIHHDLRVGARHLQRRQHVLVDVVGPGLTRDALDQIARNRRSVVRIGRLLAGRAHAGRHLNREVVSQRLHVVNGPRRTTSSQLFETRRVGQ